MQTTHPFLDAMASHATHLATTTPALDALRRASVSALAQHGIPAGKQETWKYTPYQVFYAAPFATDEPRKFTSDADTALPDFACDASIDLLGAHPDLTCCKPRAGITCTDLLDTPGLRINSTVDTQRYPLAQVNCALIENALIIRVDSHTDAGCVALRFRSGAAAATVSRVHIELAAGSALQLVEQHAEAGATNCVVEIELAEHASLIHTRVLPQAASPSWSLVSVRAAAHSTYALAGYAMGSSNRRNDIHVRLDGAHARAEIELACGSSAADRLDHQVVMEHIGTDTVSRQTVHGIAAQKSQLTFNGRIHIHPHAQRSDARLTNKNLLADATARINTKPELEIHADDVKCAHGATVGQLDPAAMFYLRSRGIDETAARTMLMHAFLASRLSQRARDAHVERIFDGVFDAVSAT
jgi:Fe-S cluster assembly protein SufD